MGQHIDALEIVIGGFTLELPQSVLNWLIIGLLLILFFYVVGKRIEKADPAKAPKGILFWGEQLYGVCRMVVGENLRDQTTHYLPFFGTLILMMAISNLLGLIGLQNPTSNISVNATLAVMMFLLIQYNAIRKAGIRSRLKELCDPFVLLLPLNVIGEVALPISLTMRLFGNMLAGSIISMLVYVVMKAVMPFGVLGFLVTPFLHFYFDIFSGLMQTFIFFTLASFFLSEQVSEAQD